MWAIRTLVALRKESVDRNSCGGTAVIAFLRSLSARRAWIEIEAVIHTPIGIMSLSARRAWIEILAIILKSMSVIGRSPQGERG